MKYALIVILIVFLLCSCTPTENPEEEPSGVNSSDIYDDIELVDEGSETNVDISGQPAAEMPEVSSGSSASEAPAEQPESSFADNYYYDCKGHINEDFYKNNTILGDLKIDPDTVAEHFMLKNSYGILETLEQYNRFIKDYSEGEKLWDMYTSNEYYYAETSIGTTAVLEIRDFEFHVDSVGLEGTVQHKFPEDKKLIGDIIDAGFDVKETDCRYISLTRYLWGILLSQGDKEAIVVTSAVFDFEQEFDVGSLYPVSEVVDFIKENKDILIAE